MSNGSWTCSVDKNGLATVRRAGWTLVFKQTGGLQAVKRTTTVHEDGLMEHWDGSRSRASKGRITELYNWALTTPEVGPTECCDHFSYHVSLWDAQGALLVDNKKVGYIPRDDETPEHLRAGPRVASLGYGIFDAVRGPPHNPDDEPLKTRDLFFVYVKEAMSAIRVAGGAPLLAAVLAEHLEMMFLPPDGHDQGFTETQRRRVFSRLFDPKSAKGMRTELGVHNMRDLKQHVLAIAIRRGYLNTARYLVEHKRGKVWEIFDEEEAGTRQFFNMLGSVPLNRRIPTLSWLLDVLGTSTLQTFAARYVQEYLLSAAVATDDIMLYKKAFPHVGYGNKSCELLTAAARSTALHTARHILDSTKREAFIGCDALLRSLFVHPYTEAARNMTTLLVTRLDIGMLDELQATLNAAMYRNRVDVFEAVVAHVPTHRSIDHKGEWGPPVCACLCSTCTAPQPGRGGPLQHCESATCQHDRRAVAGYRCPAAQVSPATLCRRAGSGAGPGRWISPRGRWSCR